MPDGTGNIDAHTIVSEPLRRLDELPPAVDQMMSGLTDELNALEMKPKYPPSEKPEHSFREGLLENARLLWTHRDEILRLFEDLIGEKQGEEAIISLVKAAIATDLGKLGPRPLNGEVPHNMVARIYRELRWEQTHVEWLKVAANFEQIEPLLTVLSNEQKQLLRENGRGRTLIPFKAALEVMRRVALEKYPEEAVGVNEVFRLTAADEAELNALGLSADMPLSQVFTGLHCRANAELLPRLNIGVPERDYAVGHHFSAGLSWLPPQIIKDYQLDGKDFGSRAFLRYVANVAILSVTDRMQGFVQRSGRSPEGANEQTALSILQELQANFPPSHPRRDEIEGIFASVIAFAVNHKFANYYAS